MKALRRLFRTNHGVIALLFGCGALTLIIIATRIGWMAFVGGVDRGAAQAIIEAIGLLAAAVVALQIAETIFEEEVIRDADISAPTRVRRFLSRFFVVILVALAIEGLVAAFKALHEDPAQLPYAASILAAVGVLLAAWGLFVHLNRSAEDSSRRPWRTPSGKTVSSNDRPGGYRARPVAEPKSPKEIIPLIISSTSSLHRGLVSLQT